MDNDFQKILSKLYSHAHPSSVAFLTEETYILAIESVYNSVVITDNRGIVQYANPATERITGYSREEVLGKKVGLWGKMMGNLYYDRLWETINKGNIYVGEIQNHRKNGDTYMARLTISPIQKEKKVIGFVGTEEDITLEKKLQKDKEEFISFASHQLRTPLGSMKWNLELLSGNNPKLKREISSLAVQNEYMIDLVNRLLIVLRIGDNRLKVIMEPTNLDGILNTIKSHFQIKLDNVSVTLDVQNPYKKMVITTDPILVREIISNLLDNAIKYSKKKGHISIRIGKTKSHWSFSIKDMGIGITHKDLPHVFEKFYRGSNTISVPGTGLGMYIVNTYIHKLLGSIKIKSVLNKGTEMVCTFPL